MTAFLKIAMNIVSLAINIGLVYFAVRLMLIFRGGKMEKSWLYIAIGTFCLAVGSFFFSAYYVFNLPTLVHPLGGAISMMGGAFILIGLKIEYKSWRGV